MDLTATLQYLNYNKKKSDVESEAEITALVRMGMTIQYNSFFKESNRSLFKYTWG